MGLQHQTCKIIVFTIFNVDFLDQPHVPFGDVLPLREIDDSGHEIRRIIGEINKCNAKMLGQH